jgi:hypothetical protein
MVKKNVGGGLKELIYKPGKVPGKTKGGKDEAFNRVL